MKKVLAAILTTTLVFSIGATNSFAATLEQKNNFIDTDNNGICDHIENAGRCVCTIGEKIRNGYGRNGQDVDRQAACGGNFVDEDKDGVCDNYATRPRPQDGTGRKNGLEGGCNRQ